MDKLLTSLQAVFSSQADPVIVEIAGVRIWYYGLAYAVGFLGMHLWVFKRRNVLGWGRRDIYDFSLIFALSVLLVGRAFDIAVYEWGYYQKHTSQILSYWRGGMATHGVLLGAIVGVAIFCRIRNRSFLKVADELVIPACIFMALGRIGNHINGEVYGFVTDVSWAVNFPYAEGYRHPVALYDGLKNLLIIPILYYVKHDTRGRTGILTAHFIFWYAFLRLFVDYFRDYDSYWLGIGRGQYFNLLMALSGLGLILWFSRKGISAQSASTSEMQREEGNMTLWLEMALFYAVVFFTLTIPSGWTQDMLEVFRLRTNS